MDKSLDMIALEKPDYFLTVEVESNILVGDYLDKLEEFSENVNSGLIDYSGLAVRALDEIMDYMGLFGVNKDFEDKYVTQTAFLDEREELGELANNFIANSYVLMDQLNEELTSEKIKIPHDNDVAITAAAYPLDLQLRDEKILEEGRVYFRD